MACSPRYQVEKTAGDDWRISVSLLLNGAAKNVAGATIRAAVVDDFTGEMAGTSVTLSDSESGAAWATGLVVAVFPKANTVTIEPGTYHLEVEVTMAGELSTWHSSSFNVRGQVLA